MRYTSTRGEELASFPKTLLEGIPKDGGLYIPETWPTFSQGDLKRLIKMRRYTDVAYFVMKDFVDAETQRFLKKFLKRAYTRKKFGSKIVPVKKLERDLYLLKVSQGPTWAFKDMALQLFAEVLNFWLKRRGEFINVIVATSGDTGSAAIEALRGFKRITITVLSPTEGNMSEAQMKQMYGVRSKRVHNIVIEGVFDDAQAIVKAIMSDVAFKDEHRLGLVNSINWLRIIAQTVYFVWAWSRIAKKPTDPIMFSVPSGNFGDAYSAFVARMLGIPVLNIIVATNDNDVLHRFFTTGRYDARVGEDVERTISPSMNIKVASNFERLLAEALKRDSEAVKVLMGEMTAGKKGWFDISGSPAFRYFAERGFVSGSCSDFVTRESIRSTYQHFGIVIDPHTAVAMHVGLRHGMRAIPLVVVETARWEKFPETIHSALGFVPPLPIAYKKLMRRENRSHQLPADVKAIKKFLARTLKKAA